VPNALRTEGRSDEAPYSSVYPCAPCSLRVSALNQNLLSSFTTYSQTLARQLPVRSVHHQGKIRYKKQEVFLGEVLRWERVGLLATDERWYTIYFAQFPIARFDSHKLRTVPLPEEKDFSIRGAEEGEVSPSLHPIPSELRRKSVRDVPGLKCQGCPRLFRF